MKNLVRFFIFSAMIFIASVARADVSSEQLVSQLGDPDPGIRSQSFNELTRIGNLARRALLKGIRSNQPAIAESSLVLWKRLPVTLPGDPQKAVDKLAKYSSAIAYSRARILLDLIADGDDALLPVVKRVADEEPSPEVLWALSGSLGASSRDRFVNLFKDRQPTTLHPAIQYMLIMQNADRSPRTTALIHQLLDQEIQHTTARQSEIDQILNYLENASFSRLDVLKLLQYRRHALSLATDDRAHNAETLRIRLLQARFGPFPGLIDDLQASRVNDAPNSTLAFAHLCQRTGAILPAAIMRSAVMDKIDQIANETEKAQIWLAMAEYAKELNELPLSVDLYSRVGDLENPDLKSLAASANIRVWSVYLQMNRFHEAGARLEKGLSAFGPDATLLMRFGDQQIRNWSRGELQGMVDWLYFKAAIIDHDKNEATRRGQSLALGAVMDSDLLVDIVDDIKPLITADQFNIFANRVYTQAKIELSESPDNPNSMNKFAWFCAKANTKLEEGMEQAQKAVQKMPKQGAYLDTLAEIYFRLGRTEEAIQTETLALETLPNDEFIKMQLQRFRAAATQPAHRVN